MLGKIANAGIITTKLYEVDLSKTLNSVYILNIENNREIISKKLIVNKY